MFCENGTCEEATKEHHTECSAGSKCLKKRNSVDIMISSHKHCSSEANCKASNFWIVKKKKK